METYNYIDSLTLSYLHVFTYSDRPEAKATKMTNKVSGKDKKNRSKRLHELGEKKKRDFYKLNAETVHSVLWESSNKNGIMSGLTENYIPVFRNYNEGKINSIENIKLNILNNNGEWEIQS